MKNFKIILSLFILLKFTSSCSEFLSEVPDNRTLLDSQEKISELLVNAYPASNYMEFAETMSDNVFDSEDLSRTTLDNSQNYYWEVQQGVDQDTPAHYWDACYRAIASANLALDAIKKLNDDPKLNPQKGEALMARAYAHFMLVSFWSKAFNPNTADKDLGIPYVFEAENVLLKEYTRNTVAEVFNFIEKDIEEGLKYVTDDYKEPKFHFNKDAAKAFASRFYLVKGDWDNVIRSTDMIGDNPVNQLRDYKSVSYTELDFASKLNRYSQVAENTNLLVVAVPSNFLPGYKLATNRFQLTGARTSDFFGNQANLFGLRWVYETFSYNNSQTEFNPKFSDYRKIVNFSSGVGFSYSTIVLLSRDECYLNRIEAHVMKNQLNLAKQELKYFISTRTKDYDPLVNQFSQEDIISKYPFVENEYTPFYSLTATQASYVKAIAEVRRREFLQEGLRWFDIKRFALEIKHDIYNQPSIVLLKDDERKLLQIPLHASDRGIEKNPR